MGLLAENRHKYILDHLRLDGRIEVKQIARDLGVTEITIRRDLALMNRDGLLKRTYGGAVLAEPEFKMSFRYRQTRNLNAKKIIGKFAGELIKDGDIIFLGSGSTCYEIIPFLAGRKDLTIIVNSLYLMNRLHEMALHKIIIVGGQYRPDRMDMVGPASEETISQLGGFKAFTGADDISIDSGLSAADVVTVRFAKLLAEGASEVIFVGDHTKFDNPALYKFAGLDKLDYIITDRKLSPAWEEVAAKENISLIHP